MAVAPVEHDGSEPIVSPALHVPAASAPAALMAAVNYGPEREGPLPSIIPPPLPPTPIASFPRRLTGSGWAILRGGARDGLIGGQLGASQAGVRLAYGIGDAQRLALVGRFATPIEGRGSEGAVGVEWRLPGLPVRLIAERRFSFDGGRGGSALSVVGGLGPQAIAPGAQIEAYGQAGLIARDGVERFADGAVRVSRMVVHGRAARLDLGVGAWGGAQRGAARLDIGPTAGLAFPVGDRTIRMALDWRQRIAGDARPGSGVALSMGGDF